MLHKSEKLHSYISDVSDSKKSINDKMFSMRKEFHMCIAEVDHHTRDTTTSEYVCRIFQHTETLSESQSF